MPKSKHRKTRKPFRGKPGFKGVYGMDPQDVLTKIGSGLMGKAEEEAACTIMLRSMDHVDPAAMTVMCQAAGLSGPPSTTDHIRAIAKALVGGVTA